MRVAASASTKAAQVADPAGSCAIVAAMQSSVRPLEGRARWAVIALSAVIVSDVVGIASDWLELDLLNRVLDGEDVPLSDLESNDDRQAAVGILVLATFVGTVVFFIRWFHAAYSNLLALGQPELRYKPGWAIGAWFVPFLNLWRPKQIADDIWRGSAPDAPTLHEVGWKSRPVPGLLNLWWGAWIVSVFVGNFAARVWFDTDTAEDLRRADIADMAGLTLDLLAAVLAIAVIRRLTARQAERAQGLELASHGPATGPATMPEA